MLETRIGFENDSFDEVFTSLESLVAKSKNGENSTLQVVSIGHQRYLQLDDLSLTKLEKRTQADPAVWTLLKELRVQKIQRIDFHFEYRMTSDKEERSHQKSRQKLQLLASRLAQHYQKSMEKEKDDRQVSVDGTSNRVEEPMEARVAGRASIIFGVASET